MGLYDLFLLSRPRASKSLADDSSDLRDLVVSQCAESGRKRGFLTTRTSSQIGQVCAAVRAFLFIAARGRNRVRNKYK